MASGITPKLPLNIGEEVGYRLITTYPGLIKQNLKNLLLTVPGERVMDSDFGVGISRYLFQQNLSYTYGEIENRVSEQIQKYMPFLELEEIRITPDKNSDSVIRVQIFYVVTPLELNDELLLTIDNVSRA
jgi:phage baseplate assembly protein W